MTDGPRNADLCSETDVEWGRTCRGWWDGGQHNPQLAPEYGGRRIPSPHSGGALEALAIEWGPGCTFVSVFLGSMPPDCLATICLDNLIPSGLLIQFCSAFENLQSCPGQRWVKAEQFSRDGTESSLALFRTGKPTTRLENLPDDAMLWLGSVKSVLYNFPLLD